MSRPYERGRPAHDQRLSLVDRKAPKRVEGCQFVAHVDPTLKFDAHGALRVLLLIPPEFADLGLDLRYLGGVPLSVDVQRWRAAAPPPAPAHPGPSALRGPVAGENGSSNPVFRRERNGG